MVRDGITSNKRERWRSRRLEAMILSLANNFYYGKNPKTNRQQSRIKSTEQKEIFRESKKLKMDNNGRATNKGISTSDEEESIREHKKMKVDNNWKSMRKCSRSSNLFDCNDILLEVLSRLPIKSLMCCKCVSKHWKFTISEDEDFINLHFTRSKQRCSDLFIVVPRHTQDDMIQRAIHNSGFKNLYGGAREYRYKQCILLGNLFETISRVRVRKLEHSPFYYTEILKPLNGLICFANRCQAAVCILNPCTRESTGWISSSLRRDKSYDFVKENERGLWEPTYFFGFDPATKTHKVLCNWKVRNNPRINICEVLTVGENNWRRIKTEMSFHDRVKVSVYANGFIYWGNTPISVPQFLNAFDVGRERFKVIKIPRKVREKCMNPPERHCGFVNINSLIEFGGHVALLQRWTSNVAKLWICSDTASISSYRSWIEMTLELPFQWKICSSVSFHGVAGANRALIESNPSLCRSDIKQVSLYSYDCEKKTSTGMVKSGVVSKLVSDSLYSKLESVSLFRPFVESLWPVRNHQFRRNQHVKNVQNNHQFRRDQDVSTIQNKKDEYHLSEPMQVINEYLDSYFRIKRRSNISNAAK